MNLNLEEFLHQSREANNVDNLFSLYSGLLAQNGFDQLTYAITSGHNEFAADAELGLVSHNMLNGWVEHYRENAYLEIDKTTHLLRANQGVYKWNDVYQRSDLSSVQKQIFLEANEAKMFNGASISVHGPAGIKGVSIASSSVASDAPEKRQYDIMNVASFHFHLCFLSLVQSKPDKSSSTVSLTFREQEVLKWVSTGMTKQEIADKLGASVHTIDFHSRNLLNKLDANNMAAALVAALKQGLLTL